MLHMLTSVAQWERETGGQRTSDAIRHVAQVAGGWKWGQAPYGYSYGPRDEEGRLTLVADPEEQRGIERIRELVAQGMAQRVIAERLTEEGFPSKQGAKWHQSIVSMVMRREGIASPRPRTGGGRKRTSGRGVRPLAAWRYRQAPP